MSNKILSVHPSYANLNFLKRFIKCLQRNYSTNIHHSQLHTTDESHKNCLETFRNNPDSFLIIMCHGTPKNIRGCNRDSYGTNEYHWGTFISSENNIDIFDSKRVLCVSCDSKTLGEAAIKAGAKVFIGFDTIRFFWPQKTDQEVPFTGISRRANASCRYEFRKSLEESVTAAIDNNYTFNQLSTHLQLALQKRVNTKIQEKNTKLKKESLEVAKSLMNIKNGITMFGDGNVLVFGKE